MNRLVYVLLLCCVVSPGVLYSATRDIIRFKDGREIEVLITKEDGKEIRYKDLQTGASQKSPVDDIEMVLYEDAPVEFKDAMDDLNQRRPGAAIKKLTRLNSKGLPKTKTPWINEYVPFYTALGWAKLAKADATEKKPKYLAQAKKQLAAFESKFKGSRFVPEAIYWRGVSALEEKEYDAGRAIFATLARNGDRPYWVSKAQGGIGQSYILEKDYDKAESHCMDQLKKGRFSEEIVQILTTILIDRKRDGKKAYAIGKKLLGRGDRDIQRAAYEMIGAAAVLLKKYEESLVALLKSKYVYSEGGSVSPRNSIYLAISIKMLMDEMPEDYPEWDYRGKFGTLYKSLRSSDQKIYSKVLKSIQ